MSFSYQIYTGDVLDRLREMPSDSIHCVVTSPPYWGLRDYGTADWDGGDPKCDHAPEFMPRSLRPPSRLGGGKETVNAQDAGSRSFKDQCGKCGAIRIDKQIGLEKTPQEFIAKLTEVFREVRRVLRPDGTCWINMGDSYAGSWGNQGRKEGRGSQREINGDMIQPVDDRRYPNKLANTGSIPDGSGLKPKDLCGIPWRLAFALQDDGWWLRQDIIWSKPNPMPESIEDRCTKAHEYLFLMTKSARYFYDAEAIKEGCVKIGSSAHLKSGNGNRHKNHAALAGQGWDAGTRNKRSVWEIPTEAFPEAHFATFPTALVEPCILAGTSEKGCCSLCGAPWRRIVSKSGGTTGKSWHNHDDDLGRGMRGGDNGKNDAAAGMKDYKVETIGWRPMCKCNAEPTACTVLDPFNGSGTTGVVALRNRCNYIGIELNPEYAAMAERRLLNATRQGVLL